MIRNYLLILTAFIGTGLYGQDTTNNTPRSHEIKANAFNLIVFKSPEFTYEYLISPESSFGISVLFNLEDRENRDFLDGPYYEERFSVTPHYRRYFSSRHARGFFMEAFGMYNVQEDFDGIYDTDLDREVFSNDKSNNLAFGIALGGKVVSRGGFVFDFYGGIGRNIYTSDKDVASELVPRLGLSLGYRF